MNARRLLTVLLSLVVVSNLLVTIGCGGNVPVAVVLSPATVNLNQGASQKFTATVTGSRNTAVSWSVQEGSAGGQVDSDGTYVAPATAGVFHLVAASLADRTKSAVAVITVPAVALTVSPNSLTLDQGATQQFVATVTGSVNRSVVWTIQEGPEGGAVTSGGLYSVPAHEGTFHVVATSAADPTKAAAAVVTVPAAALALSPNSLTLDQGATQQFAATVTGSVNKDVAWSVLEGATGGAVTSGGLYSAPAHEGTYHVVAASVANSVAKSTAEVTVPPVSISMNRSSVSLLAGKSCVFSASVHGTVDTRVTWAVQEGSAGGSIDNDGAYTAPADPGTYHVVATSVAEPIMSAIAKVFVLVVNSEFVPAGTMTQSRRYHTATLLPNGDVLLTGGTGDNSQTLASAELFDHATGSFRPTGTMNSARQAHTAALLVNGKVLIAGGFTSGGATDTAEIYDPATGQFTATGSMASPRGDHTATLLSDGKVLIIGGTSVTTAEVYDPVAGKFTSTASMGAARAAHTATLLSDGRVLVTGGSVDDYFFLDSAEIFDPTANVFTAAASLSGARSNHTATLLPDGRVLVAGGHYENWEDWPAIFSLADVHIFTPASDQYSAVEPMNASRNDHTATLLPNGQVLIIGGLTYDEYAAYAIADAELFDPVISTFVVVATMAEPRAGHTATLLLDGRVLVAGGASAELYVSH